MENLEKMIYDELIAMADIDESEIEDFTYDSPIFNSPGHNGRSCLGLDSVDALELVVMIYDKFGIDVPSEDISRLKTVNAIAYYIRDRKDGQL